MNLYKVTRTDLQSFAASDAYDALVVAAPDEETAREIEPESSRYTWTDDSQRFCQVELLGKAKRGTEVGIVLGSFNAG